MGPPHSVVEIIVNEAFRMGPLAHAHDVFGLLDLAPATLEETKDFIHPLVRWFCRRPLSEVLLTYKPSLKNSRSHLRVGKWAFGQDI